MLMQRTPSNNNPNGGGFFQSLLSLLQNGLFIILIKYLFGLYLFERFSSNGNP